MQRRYGTPRTARRSGLLSAGRDRGQGFRFGDHRRGEQANAALGAMAAERAPASRGGLEARRDLPVEHWRPGLEPIVERGLRALEVRRRAGAERCPTEGGPGLRGQLSPPPRPCRTEVAASVARKRRGAKWRCGVPSAPSNQAMSRSNNAMVPSGNMCERSSPFREPWPGAGGSCRRRGTPRAFNTSRWPAAHRQPLGCVKSAPVCMRTPQELLEIGDVLVSRTKSDDTTMSPCGHWSHLHLHLSPSSVASVPRRNHRGGHSNR